MTLTAPRLRHRHGTSCTWAAEKRPLGGHRASHVGPRLLASLQARETSSRQPRGVSAKMLPLHIAVCNFFVVRKLRGQTWCLPFTPRLEVPGPRHGHRRYVGCRVGTRRIGGTTSKIAQMFKHDGGVTLY